MIMGGGWMHNVLSKSVTSEWSGHGLLYESIQALCGLGMILLLRRT